MSERERLIAILEKARMEAGDTMGSMNGGMAAWYADKLLEAGVVLVIRCKDCGLRRTGDCAMCYECYDCESQSTWETDNDYCSWGKRKEGRNER